VREGGGEACDADRHAYQVKSLETIHRRPNWRAYRVRLFRRGQHKPFFTPHADCGDYVVVSPVALLLLCMYVAIAQVNICS
jgi:hypothetical protein